ncbi:membrane protein insertion efficiency factor YidD [Candidatus Falkowbacteria bacterium CG10_big_fil_rev_8_21_14_0_10_39_11]|uniref:Putative membrane protein insertion efficiency factor n=1 Tax=Candidatus Falkowbacteria bacterium CG10_big_fil_rev_8_21_14_0_10_39_11 TaxID=1974565 RepID=A0A2H0V3S4_9BACT|nr:MAG: membrane protein insertion efficiency factor YidD [Candidatus Falkowbacteria bacterium CG10_big_fil_rev_8_21_14_0_10_39_11]
MQILWPRMIVLRMIKIYQKTLSPDHGHFKYLYPNGYCRYHPTCSCYGYEAIEKYGIFRGGIMAGWRILRCNPWSKGGNDPVDKVNKQY